MILAFSTILLVVAALFLYATLAAVRSDQLMVFRMGDLDLFLFARRPSGRYERVTAWGALAEVVRHGLDTLTARARRPRPALVAGAARVEPRFARLART